MPHSLLCLCSCLPIALTGEIKQHQKHSNRDTMSQHRTGRKALLTVMISLLLKLLGPIEVSAADEAKVNCTVVDSETENCWERIVENADDGTMVFNAQGYIPHAIFLSVGSGNFAQHFTKDNNVVRTKGSFDRESMVDQNTAPDPVWFKVSFYTLVGDGVQVLHLNILVIDLDDNVPRFKINNKYYDGSYSLQTHETDNLKTLLTIVAEDYDEGVNGTSSYTLGEGSSSSFNITVDSNNGGIPSVQLESVKPLDRETEDFHRVYIIAKEGTDDPHVTTLTVNINITDVDDNTPYFSTTQFTVVVSEDTKINATVVNVNATDDDLGSNAEITYNIKSVCSEPDPGSACGSLNEPWPFTLDSESGVLTINQMLNYEDAVKYIVTIGAKNPNNPNGGSSTAIVKVTVKDINDHPPKVIDFSASGKLSEDSVVGSLYATFRIQDDDSAEFSKYKLRLLDRSTMKDSTTFELQNSSNLITVTLAAEVDRETQDRYELELVATDALNSSLSTTYLFNVEISDKNDHKPEFIPISNPHYLEEESYPNTEVVHLNATDKDIGSNAEIKFTVPGNTDEYKYQADFCIKTGENILRVKGKLDREKTPNMVIKVRAQDQNGKGLFTDMDVNISLIDINDNAPNITSVVPATSSVLENMTVGTPVLDVDATDADIGINAKITFSLTVTSPKGVDPPVSIDPHSGIISANDNLDHENYTQYTMEVSASDGVNTPATKVWKLIVLDVNDNDPYFPQTVYLASLYENASIDSHVTTVSANDIDSAQFTQITYSFANGYDHSPFKLNTETGEISTSATLDREVTSKYSFKVVASDGHGRISSVHANVTVKISDVNDEIPQFTNEPYIFTIPENSSLNENIGQVTTFSKEAGDHGNAVFSIINTNTVPFHIDPSTGFITVTEMLDREKQDQYELYIEVDDVAPPANVNTTTALVIVTDVNDNPPVFAQTQISIQLSELQTVNKGFFTAVATDRDLFPNNVTQYSLSESESKFQIDSDTGVLSLTSSLNYEKEQSLLVVVTAKDSLKPAFTATLQVNISVLDDNNTNISFPSSFPLFYSISEDSPLGTMLLNFTAQDSKGNPLLHLNYFLSYAKGGVSTDFSIDVEASSGHAILSTSNTLDRETKSSYALNITITDHNSPANYVTQFLTVSLSDVNDNTPMFIDASYVFSVLEEQPGSQLIDSVKAVDPDKGENGTVTYSLKEPSAFFSINSNTGAISQSQPLDRESVDTHTITVIASDGGDPSKKKEMSVTINVLDVNDNCPEFTPSYITIDENIHSGTLAVTIETSDADAGLNGQVLLKPKIQHSTATTNFHMFANGSIYVIKVPDYEQENMFIYFFEVSDGGTIPCKVNGNITIEIKDLNDNCPTFIGTEEDYVIKVSEDTATGVNILNITAVDPDSGMAGDVNYVLESRADRKQFEIGVDDGIFRLTKKLDYETKTQHVIAVLAYDNGRPRNWVCRQNVTVNVKNINEEEPYFDLAKYEFVVKENQPSQTLVGRFRGYDGDSDSTLEYTYNQLMPSGNDFVISEAQGYAELKTLTSFDHETQAFYILEVIVSDGQKQGQTVVEVFIENLNDENPSFSSSMYAVSVSELQSVGSTLLFVMATDGDNETNDAVSYSITDGNEGDKFFVDSTTGEIRVNGELDYETKTSYSLEVTANDTGDEPRLATSTVVVTILNENEDTPTFSSSDYYFSIKEEQNSVTTVGQVTAADGDAGDHGNIKYSLQSSSDMFSIDTDSGIIKTTTSIDREATPTVGDLVVVAEDSSKSSTATVHITVIDINDNAPIFADPLYQFSIPHNQDVGVSIAKVASIDMDSSENAVTTYSLSSVPEGAPFSVNSTAGYIYLTSSLPSDYEPSYKFTLVATDAGDSSFSNQTTVEVFTYTNTNHPPFFKKLQYETNVTENDTLSGNVILTVTATDEDQISLAYSLDEDYDKFSISSNGQISLINPLDYEEATSYELIVYAADSTPSEPRTASATVTVTVININDEEPEFVNAPSAITLSPVPYTGVDLFQLQASDPDRSSVSFELLSQTNKFEIDSETGIVSNRIVLENGTVNSLEFRLSDGTYQIYKTIMVSVATPPASAPHFTKISVMVSVLEGFSLHKTITTFTAIHPSEYNLVCCGSAGEVFQVDSDGDLSLKKSLDYETKTEYDLVIEAREETGSVVYSDYLKVDLKVINVNEDTPTFIGNADKSVNEGLSSGAVVTQVEAIDGDLGSYGDITFSIIQGNTDQTFDIDESLGAIKLASGKTLDREEEASFELLVKAADGAGKFSTSTVVITVLDLNDSPPTFSGNFTVGVYEPGKNGDRVMQVAASDPDSTSQLHYSLGLVQTYLKSSYVGIASNIFVIDSSTAVVSLNKAVDRESVDLYVIPVSVTDNIFTASTYLKVKVLDVNDKEPAFGKKYNANINELTKVGRVLIDVSATDGDSMSNRILRYSLGDGWPEGKFIIDEASGTIRVNEPIPFLNCDVIQEFVGTVNVTDGYYTTSTTVTVRVVDINNHAPHFVGSPYMLQVSETAQVGDVITEIIIEDDDCALNAAYNTFFPEYYHYPSDLFEFRMVENGRYELIVKNPLVEGVFHFRLQAFNHFPYPYTLNYLKSGFGTVTVTVLPENVHAPNFISTQYTFSVLESISPPSEVGRVQASDPDLGEPGRVGYTIIEEEAPFKVDAVSGIVTVSGPLDYESVSQYVLVVLATDHGFPSKSSNVSVTVNVLDVNDNPPTFLQSRYESSVIENARIGTKVLMLNVNDSDSLPSSSLRFSLTTSSEASFPFTVNMSTGVIVTSGDMDYETQHTYRFTVVVQDLEMMSLSSSAEVIVGIIGVNEFVPVFLSSYYNEPIVVPAELQNGDLVTTIVANDSDEGADGTLTYRFTDPQQNYFTMLPNGSIYLAVESVAMETDTSRKKRQNRDITVTAGVVAEDGGTPPQSATINITLILVDREKISQKGTDSTSIIATAASIGGVVFIIFLMVVIIGSILAKCAKARKRKYQLSATNAHRSSTRASTPCTSISTATNLELHSISRNENDLEYIEHQTQLGQGLDRIVNMESPDSNDQIQALQRPSRSTSDLASSVATDALNLTQDGGYQLSKAQIEHIYATNIGLLNDHSQDSVHMFGSEGGGEAEGDELDDMMFAKYDLEMETTDDTSYTGKSRHSIISESSEGGHDDYQFSQSTNPWSSRHSIVNRSMNELPGEASRPLMYQYDSSQQAPGMYSTSTQGSSISLSRSMHPRKYGGSDRDLPLYPGAHHNPHPPRHHHHHYPGFEYFPDMPLRYGSPVQEYRTDSGIPTGVPPPAYLSQDPYSHRPYMGQRISPDPNQSLPPYEHLLSNSSTSLSTNASHQRGTRPYHLMRETNNY